MSKTRNKLSFDRREDWLYGQDAAPLAGDEKSQAIKRLESSAQRARQSQGR